MSQMTSLVKAEKAVAKESVLVRTEAVRPRKAQAPTGNGLRTRPAMVERKMESNCHAWGVISGGFGMRKRRMSPIEIEIIKGMSLGPDDGGRGVICEDVEGWFGKFEEAWIGVRRGLKKEGFWVWIRGKKREEEEDDRRVGME